MLQSGSKIHVSFLELMCIRRVHHGRWIQFFGIKLKVFSTTARSSGS
jgi:hypothetical protein